MRMTRRNFIKLSGTSLIIASSSVKGANAFSFLFPKKEVKCLSLYNTHTGESIQDIPFWENGKIIKDAKQEINKLLRDHRTNTNIDIDNDLLDLLYKIQNKLGVQNKSFDIVSAYRSPQTNKMLRTRIRGVARNSMHMFGKAIDFRIKGVSTKDINKAALSLKAGGVGYYPRSQFVHIDTGRVRRWGG